MAANDDSKLCVVCKKEVKSSETVIVCGLWCRKFFHNECVGLSNSEARAVTCRKERIKFHCEACEKRLGIELFGEQQTHEPKNLQDCANNCVNLFELVQKLFKLTNKVSNDNSAINTKLDRVLTSNARLEDLLQSTKRFEIRNEETSDNSVEYVESYSNNQILEIREQNNDTNSQKESANGKQTVRCASQASSQQQIDYNDPTAPHTASVFPRQFSDSQQQNSVEGCSSDYLQKWEAQNGHNSIQDHLSTGRGECSPSEDFPMCNTFSVVKTEQVEDDENAVSEDYGEACSPSEDFLSPSTFNPEKTEDYEDLQTVSDDDLEELKPEVEFRNSGSEPGSTNATGTEDGKIIDDSSSLVTSVSLSAGTGNSIRCTTMQETHCGDKFGVRHLRCKCGTRKKKFVQLQDLKEHRQLNRHEHLNSCHVCHKTFTRAGNLKDHYRVHTGERPYSCVVCEKTFKQGWHLKQHLRVHTGERPYICGVCNKKFTQSAGLMRHSQVHTGERPYSCEVCHKRFRSADHFRDHKLLHFGERPYTCNICQKKFSYNSGLSAHMLLHKKKNA